MTLNNRARLLILGVVTVALLATILVFAAVLPEARPGDGARHLPVSLEHPFGTDRMGRDMFTRTVAGARVSLLVGALSVVMSVAIAVIVAILAAIGPRWLDRVTSWLIDVTIGLPGIILMILVSFAAGGGVTGTVLAIAVTHWPQLARVLRAEIMKVRSADYVTASLRQGYTRTWIATRHLAPALSAQVIIGLVVLYPGAVVHETTLTFLGLGIEPTNPSLGVILAEAMGYLTGGQWWLVAAPIAVLVTATLLLGRLGNTIGQLLSPETRHL